MYLGLLYAMEDLAVYETYSYLVLNSQLNASSFRYGYITNTRVKLVVVVSVTDGIIRDADMKAVSLQTTWVLYRVLILSTFLAIP